MPWQELEFWFVVASTVSATLAGLIGRAIRANSRRIEDLERRHTEREELIRDEARHAVRSVELQLEGKVERHESDIAALQAAQITHDDLGRIYQRLEPLAEGLGEVKGSIDALSTQLGIVTQHLLAKD